MHNFVYLAERRSQEFSCEPLAAPLDLVPRRPYSFAAVDRISTNSSSRGLRCVNFRQSVYVQLLLKTSDHLGLGYLDDVTATRKRCHIACSSGIVN